MTTATPAPAPAPSGSIPDVVRAYLATSGLSQRALSLEAGLNEKAVSQLLIGRTQRPHAAALAGLSRVVGVDLGAIASAPTVTVADMQRILRETPPHGWSPSVLRGATSALKLYERFAGGGACAGSPPFDRASVRKFLAANTPASLGVSPATCAAYASHLRALLDMVGGGGRTPQIRDVTGRWRWLYDAVAETDLPQDLVWAAGPFFAWCDAQGIEFTDLTAETFVAYRDHRITHGGVTGAEAKHTKASKRARDLWNHLATLPVFADLGVRAAEQPFADGRVRYATPDALLAPLLAEFDEQVVPWVTGKTTPQGRPVDEILDEIEAIAAPPRSAKVAAARRYNGKASQNRKSAREERLRACGVLLAAGTWGPKRVAVARAGIISLVKCFFTTTGTLIETMAELSEPDLLEAAAEALDEATDFDDVGSSYVSTLVKLVRKIAVGFVGVGAVEAARISHIIVRHTPDRAGVSPRNKLKLQQFTPDRIDAFFGMSGALVAEVNAEVARRRAANRRAAAAGRKPVELLDAEIARKLELVVAHDIFCARAPRKANVLGIDLDRHVRDAADGTIIVELPPEMVKGGRKLVIPLNPRMSAVFRQHIAKARPLLLTDANRGSMMLFPARKRAEGHYTCLTVQLMREIHERVGVKFNPHLYRHLVGWVWLKNDPSKLPQVQILLGHKNIATTLKFYAELDETLALQQWSDRLEGHGHGDRNNRRTLAA